MAQLKQFCKKEEGDDEESEFVSQLGRINCDDHFFARFALSVMTSKDLVKALGRYTSETKATDQQTARIVGIKHKTLRAWLDGADPPQKSVLARLAGFLRRVGYL